MMKEIQGKSIFIQVSARFELISEGSSSRESTVDCNLVGTYNEKSKKTLRY